MPDQQTINRIKSDLLTARKERDQVKTTALQSLLARVSNAEAVAAPAGEYVARVGVGSTEAKRRALTDQDIQRIISDEINELKQALLHMADHPDHPYAAELQQKIDQLTQYL